MEQAVNLIDIYNELKRIERSMVTKQELRSFVETLEIASNEETMKQIRNSEADIKAGRVRVIASASDL